MRRIRRYAWSAAERRELWERWKQGQGLTEIARALSRPIPSVENWVKRCGGIAPSSRRRSERVLQLTEREEIAVGLAGGMSIRQIARRLGRAPSTVSREVRRHAGAGGYRA